MKLLKKYLPFAAITSAVAIVSPIITSCSATSVKSLDWKPSKQHDEATITLNWEDLTTYKELSKDYFESNTHQYFKEDMCYTELEQVQNSYDSRKSTEGVSDLKLDFSISITNIKLESITLKLPISEQERDIPGYKVSFKIDIKTEWQYKYTETPSEGNITKTESNIVNTSTTSETVNNFFVCLMLSDNNKFRYSVFSHDSLDWYRTISVNSNITCRTKNTYKDGSTEEFDEPYSTSYTTVYTKKSSSGQNIISDSPYYLDKVTYTF